MKNIKSIIKTVLGQKIWVALKRWKLRLAGEKMLRTEYENTILNYPTGSEIGERARNKDTWTDFSLIFKKFITDPKAIIEVGPNIGIDSLQIARLAPRAEIIVFEPADKYRKALTLNLSANNIKNVLVSDYCVSSKSGATVTLAINSTSASAAADVSPSFPTTSTQNCTTITLDDFFKAHPVNSLAFLKTDTDGHELEVLRGGTNTIKKFKPFIFIEFSDYQLQKQGESQKSLAKLLEELGYEPKLLYKEQNSLPVDVGGGWEELLELLQPGGSSDVFVIPK